MHLIRCVALLSWPSLVCLMSLTPALAAQPAQVVDEAAQPVAIFEFMVHTEGEGYTRWAAGKDGVISWVQTFARSPRVDVLVRAEGFAPAVEVFEGQRLDGLRMAPLVLKRGTPVELRFRLPEGLTWPEQALPEAFFADYEDRVRMMRQPSNRRRELPDFNMLNLQANGPGRFEFRLTPQTPPFHVAVHQPGFLQNFETGPFTLADFVDGVLEISLPRPAGIEATFSPLAADDGSLPFKAATLDLMWNQPGQRNSYLTVNSASDPAARPRITQNDLAPGKYLLWLSTQPKEGMEKLPGTEINFGIYSDQQPIVLEAGQTRSVDLKQRPYDPDAFRGDRSATIRVLAPGGEPATGRTLQVGYWDGHLGGHYGALEVFKGPIPTSGAVTLENITARARSDMPGPYVVQVDDKQLGVFSLAGKDDPAEFEFRIAPLAGDPAPDVPLVEIETGNRLRLQDFRGKLVLVEFWATWCGPCQPAMEKLNQLAADKAAAWKDQVALLPLSIDDKPELAARHSLRRGWKHLEHYWTGAEGFTDTDSPGARAFVVQGVPTAVLIGRDGRIVWRGHPLHASDGIDLVTRIDRILKQD